MFVFSVSRLVSRRCAASQNLISLDQEPLPNPKDASSSSIAQSKVKVGKYFKIGSGKIPHAREGVLIFPKPCREPRQCNAFTSKSEGQPASRFVHFHFKVRKGNSTWARGRGRRGGRAAFIKKLPVPFSLLFGELLEVINT